jgi:hypothetical protein
LGLPAGLLGHHAADVDQVVGNHPEADPDAAIRAEASSIKRSSDFLALYRWKRERQKIIVGGGSGGGRGTLQSIALVGFTNQILRQIKSLRYIRQPKSAAIMNKVG